MYAWVWEDGAARPLLPDPTDSFALNQSTRIPNWTMRFSSTVLDGCRYDAPGVARPFESTATAVFNEVMFLPVARLFTSTMNFGLMHSQMTAKLRV